jgi:hypothetical protein
VIWEDAGTGKIVGRALAAGGQPIGSEIQISEGPGQRAAVAANPQAKALVVWDGFDGSGIGVFARLLNASGAPAGPAFRVNSDTAARQGRAAVAAGRDGDFFVAWQGEHPELWEGFFYLYGRTVSAGGSLVGEEARLYAGSLGDGSPQISPSLAPAPGGHFLLAWLTWRASSDFTAAAVELDAHGVAVGDGFWLTQAKVQRTFRDLAVAADDDGSFLVSWEAPPVSPGTASPPRNRPGIAARRLSSH